MLVSILICTHNRAHLLSRTLESLREMKVVQGVDLELVIVSNGCTDQTTDVIESARQELHIPLRSFEETEANLNLARNRCLSEAKGEIFAFLDDDVWVGSEWLGGLLEVYRDFPADLLAGRTTLWWESGAAPSWVSPRVERLLSKLEHGDRIIELNRPGQIVGANFSFKRKVYETVEGFAAGLDRAGPGLLSGGDSEFIGRALLSGFRLFYAPKMIVRHWIPLHRASKQYLTQLARGRGRTRVALSTAQNQFKGLKLLRSGLTELLQGSLKESFSLLTGNEKVSFSGRLLRMRGAGIIDATLRYWLHSARMRNE